MVGQRPDRPHEQRAHAPRRAHQQARDGRRVARREFLAHDHVDGQRRLQQRVARDEQSQARLAADHEEREVERRRQREREPHDAARADAVGEPAAGEAPERAGGQVDGGRRRPFRHRAALLVHPERQERGEARRHRRARDHGEVEQRQRPGDRTQVGEPGAHALRVRERRHAPEPGVEHRRDRQPRQRREPGALEPERADGQRREHRPQRPAERAARHPERHRLAALGGALAGERGGLRVERRDAEAAEHEQRDQRPVAGRRADRREEHRRDERAEHDEPRPAHAVGQEAEGGLRERRRHRAHRDQRADQRVVEPQPMHEQRQQRQVEARIRVDREMRGGEDAEPSGEEAAHGAANLAPAGAAAGPGAGGARGETHRRGAAADEKPAAPAGWRGPRRPDRCGRRQAASSVTMRSSRRMNSCVRCTAARAGSR